MSKIFMPFSTNDEYLVQIGVLVVYLGISFGAAAPGCPRGYNGAGGLSEKGEYKFCTGGIHNYIDNKLLGYKQLYHHPTCLDVYLCQAYDPEGVLGSLSAVSLTYLGLMTGRILVHFKGDKERLLRWTISAIVLLLIGGVLCGFTQDEGV